MLSEPEWECLSPLLERATNERKTKTMAYLRREKVARGTPAQDEFDARYFEITGRDAREAVHLWHHRIALQGSPCRFCNKPLRTPNASYCAACGR